MAFLTFACGFASLPAFHLFLQLLEEPGTRCEHLRKRAHALLTSEECSPLEDLEGRACALAAMYLTTVLCGTHLFPDTLTLLKDMVAVFRSDAHSTFGKWFQVLLCLYSY